LSAQYLEKQVLGCFLQDNSLLKETNIRTNHFSESHHAAIYKAMLKLSGEGKSIDHISLMTECYDMLQDLGGPDYVMGIQTKGKMENYPTYEQTLLEQYKERATNETLQAFLTDTEKDIPTLLSKLQTIESEGVSDESKIYDVLADMLNLPYEKVEQDITGISSGLKELDMLTMGWQKGESIILGARPSMGKTALMLKFILSAAESGAIPVVFSLEMSTKSLVKRLISSVGVIAGYYAKQPHKMQDNKKQDWVDAVGYISNLKFEIYDKPMQSIQEIRAKTRKAKRDFPDQDIMVFIDYLTLITNNGNFNNDHQKVTDISAKLKGMAKEFNCPVLTLAQLSRGVESRENKRPMNSDLRDSGSIEQDADVIIFLYRESYYDKNVTDNTLEVILSKQREGPTGVVKVDYNRSTGVIKDL